jgi:hypothetical protein
MEGVMRKASTIQLALRRWALLLAAILIGACAAPRSTVEAPIAVVPPPNLRNGDTWVYAQIEGYSGRTERYLTNTLVTANEGFVLQRRSDRPGEPVQTEIVPAPWRQLGETTWEANRAFDAPLSRIPFPIAPGQAWQEQATVTDQPGVNRVWRVHGRAIGWDRVRTPAGEFLALRVERRMNLGNQVPGWTAPQVFETYWYAPEVKRWVRLEHQYARPEPIATMLSPYHRQGRADRTLWVLWDYRPAG